MRQFILFIFFYFLTCFTSVFAQKHDINKPVALKVESGVWVYLGNQIPQNTEYQIERKNEKSGKYENIGKVEAPASLNQLEERQNTYNPSFKALEKLDKQQLSKLWEYLRSHSTTDSLYTNNLPITHLLCGTAFFDSNAKKGESYKYRITLQNSGGKQITQRESNGTSEMRESILPLIRPSSSRYANGKLSLIWSVKDVLDMRHFNIYRSILGQDVFEKIQIEKGYFSDKDSFMLLAIDTIGTSPAWYDYKITPVDPYGKEGEPQSIISGGNIQEFYAPPVTNFKAINTKNNHEIYLSWHFENKKYLNGINIMRSRNFDSGYVRIATVPFEDTSYVDIVPESGENFFYYLELVSAADEPLQTAVAFAAYNDDNSIILPPDEVYAITDPEGIVVYWMYDESYVKGFYVYRRVSNTQDFHQISPFILASDTTVYSFADTSELIQSGEVYDYVIRAINEDGQISQDSEIVTSHSGKSEDLTPPMNLRFREDDGVITIIWDDMRSWNVNLAGYKIFRSDNDAALVELTDNEFLYYKNFYIDSTVTTSVKYSYSVICTDIFGNQSTMSQISLPELVEETISTPAGINVTHTSDGMYISWGQLATDYKGIRIYRSEPDQKPILLGTITSNDNFTDKKIEKGKLYFYQLSTINNKDKEGQMSQKISVRVK